MESDPISTPGSGCCKSQRSLPAGGPSKAPRYRRNVLQLERNPILVRSQALAKGGTRREVRNGGEEPSFSNQWKASRNARILCLNWPELECLDFPSLQPGPSQPLTCL